MNVLKMHLVIFVPEIIWCVISVPVSYLPFICVKIFQLNTAQTQLQICKLCTKKVYKKKNLFNSHTLSHHSTTFPWFYKPWNIDEYESQFSFFLSTCSILRKKMSFIINLLVTLGESGIWQCCRSMFFKLKSIKNVKLMRWLLSHARPQFRGQLVDGTHTNFYEHG